MLVNQIPITWTADQVRDQLGSNSTAIKAFHKEQTNIVRQMTFLKSSFYDGLVPDSISLKEVKAVFFVAGRKPRHPILDRPIYVSGMAVTMTDRLVLFDILPKSATVPSGPLSIVQFDRNERVVDLEGTRFKMGAMDVDLPDVILKVYDIFNDWVREQSIKDVFNIPTRLPNLSYWAGKGDWTFLDG